MTPEQQRALALARARVRVREQEEASPANRSRATPVDPRERQAQEALGGRRVARAVVRNATPLGIGHAIEPFANALSNPEGRAQLGRNIAGIGPAIYRATDPRNYAGLGRAILGAPEAAQRTAAATPQALESAGRYVGEGFAQDPNTPERIEQRRRITEGVAREAPGFAFNLARELTVASHERSRERQDELDLERERQRLGLPANADLNELASAVNAEALGAGLSLAFGPANVNLVRGAARGLRGLATDNAVTRGLQTLRPSTPAQRAVRMIDRRLQQADRTIDDVAATSGRLSRQGGGIQETIAEIGGKPLQNAARAVANVEGPGQQIAETFLAERAERVGQRVMSEVTRAAEPQQTRAPRDYWDASDALQTARSGQAREGYRALYGYGKGSTAQAYDAAVQERLLPYLRQAPPEAAASGARQLATEAGGIRAELARAQQRGAADDEIAALQAELDDMALSQRQLEGLATGQAPGSVTTRAVDYFQRGLSQMERAAGMGSPEARALGNTRRAFNGMADDLIPPFNDVRTRYAAAERIQEFMDQGRRVFSMAEGEINLMLRGQSGRGLSMEEFDGFMLGVMDALQTKIRAGDTRFVSQFMRNENWQAQLERAFTPPPDRARRALEALRRRSASRGGPPRPITQQEVVAQQQRMARAATKRMYSRIEREAHMQDFNNAMRAGSRTTPMAQDIKGLTTGEDSFGFIGEIIEGGGNVKMWGIRQLARIWDKLRRPGIYDPEVNRELAQRLFMPATTGNVAKLREELAALRRRGVRLPAGVERDLVNVANRLSADSATSRGGQPQRPLPMDEASRMARAREMGFDTDRMLYHGTDQAIDSLRPSNGWYGRGVYTSRSPTQAEYYTRRTPDQMRGGAGEPAPNIMPLIARGKFAPHEEWLQLIRQYSPRGRYRSGDGDRAAVRAQAELRRRGYDGVDAGGLDQEVLVFDPKNLRSPHAAFDPARSESSDLLAGAGPIIAAGIGAGALASGDAHAQEASPELEEARAEVERLREGQRLLRQASQTHARADVMAAQQFLQGEGFYDYDTDGAWGDITRDAIRDFNNGPHFAEAQTTLATLERDEVARRNRAPGWQQALREHAPTAALLAGLALGHRSRLGAVRHNAAQVAERNAQADQIIARAQRSNPQGRMSALNEYAQRGGARPRRVPYRSAPGTERGMEPNPRAAEMAELFPQKGFLGRVSGNDAAYLAATGGESVVASIGRHYAEQEVQAARAEVAAHPDSDDARNRLERALDLLATAKFLENAGRGLAGGRLSGALVHPYSNARPSSITRAGAMRATLERAPRPRPQRPSTSPTPKPKRRNT